MSPLNFHHLRYFWAIAHDGSLTRAAGRLNVSPSALSIQLQQLEQRLGHTLFERGKRKQLRLTEAGRLVLDHADVIFRTGDELLSTLKGRGSSDRQILRIGATATLSRNFQLEFLRPLIERADVELLVRTGSINELVAELRDHTIDLVLSNNPAPHDVGSGWHSQLVHEQPVGLVARRERRRKRFRFPEDLRTTPVVLPGPRSNIRVAFDLLMAKSDIRPVILAEVDDMAMLRLFACECPGVTLVPPVVVQDELRSGQLVQKHRIPAIKESFYAITRERRFPNPLLRELLSRHSKMR
jgi:LysR family transcriptional activator of nhaA